MDNANEIDTSNTQLVGVDGDSLVVFTPKRKMTRTEALVHAAWLVAIADRSYGYKEFYEILIKVLDKEFAGSKIW